ncbi:hypothetical protein Q5P01_000427 [Channa striata]|uniref:Uncharacterized protein n=1 Tax=Channa striata TaxID=64152 RepID=A0AA88IVJ4_CHASR|nr:hypothetical protein Q5P01_000427 [Channa striata]
MRIAANRLNAITRSKTRSRQPFNPWVDEDQSDREARSVARERREISTTARFTHAAEKKTPTSRSTGGARSTPSHGGFRVNHSGCRAHRQSPVEGHDEVHQLERDRYPVGSPAERRSQPTLSGTKPLAYDAQVIPVRTSQEPDQTPVRLRRWAARQPSGHAHALARIDTGAGWGFRRRPTTPAEDSIPHRRSRIYKVLVQHCAREGPTILGAAGRPRPSAAMNVSTLSMACLLSSPHTLSERGTGILSAPAILTEDKPPSSTLHFKTACRGRSSEPWSCWR